MQLYVIRHAIAEDAAAGQGDASRALTPEGRRKLRTAVKGMRALRWRCDRILTSPWLRAAETAAQLAPLCAEKPLASDLLCQRPTAELLALIAASVGTANLGVAVVGHEPWLGELISWLAFGDPRHGDALQLKKASAAWLDGSAVPGGMTLRALVPPRLFRSLR